MDVKQIVYLLTCSQSEQPGSKVAVTEVRLVRLVQVSRLHFSVTALHQFCSVDSDGKEPTESQVTSFSSLSAHSP